MIDKIIEQLKEASGQIDVDIKNASARMLSSKGAKLKSARMKIQEAITELLECDN